MIEAWGALVQFCSGSQQKLHSGKKQTISKKYSALVLHYFILNTSACKSNNGHQFKSRTVQIEKNQFDCRLFVSDLRSSSVTVIRNRTVPKRDSVSELTIHIIAEECQRMTNMKTDSWLTVKTPAVNEVDRAQLASRE
ncbi:hypothetical protein AHF37_10239 [Paragonimus kellicotti]|nr:hypothetical protein AHF37_10239 [Paragonimus kellicotti]